MGNRPDEPAERPKRSSIQQIGESLPVFGLVAVVLFVVAGIQMLGIDGSSDLGAFPHAVGVFSLGFAALSILVAWSVIRRS